MQKSSFWGSSASQSLTITMTTTISTSYWFNLSKGKCATQWLLCRRAILQAGRFESITAARDGCPIKPHLAGNSVQKGKKLWWSAKYSYWNKNSESKNTQVIFRTKLLLTDASWPSVARDLDLPRSSSHWVQFIFRHTYPQSSNNTDIEAASPLLPQIERHQSANHSPYSHG